MLHESVLKVDKLVFIWPIFFGVEVGGRGW